MSQKRLPTYYHSGYMADVTPDKASLTTITEVGKRKNKLYKLRGVPRNVWMEWVLCVCFVCAANCVIFMAHSCLMCFCAQWFLPRRFHVRSSDNVHFFYPILTAEKTNDRIIPWTRSHPHLNNTCACLLLVVFFFYGMCITLKTIIQVPSDATRPRIYLQQSSIITRSWDTMSFTLCSPPTYRPVAPAPS